MSSTAALSADILFNEEEEEEEELPKEKSLKNEDIYKWKNFWFLQHFLEAVKAVQSNFTARNEDIILASPTKTGCTWLKALIPCIMDEKSRTINNDSDHEDILTNHHPNELMLSLELQVFNPSFLSNYNNFLLEMSSPRLFRTHIPFELLSESVKQSRCKMVYIVRDPKDVFVSLWYFVNSGSNINKPYPIEETFDKFCRGIHTFGPFHDHVLGYWKASQERPDKILFLKYEDMKKNPVDEVTKLALFLGKPFLTVEEAEKVLWRCSFERLKNMEVNKEGLDPWSHFPKNAYFRKGVVGDWKNHLTPEMKQRLDQITRDKFQGFALDIFSHD